MNQVKDNDVAMLALMTGKSLTNLVGPDSGLNTHTRVDWRNFVDTKVPPPHMQQQPQYYQQQPAYDYTTPINNQAVNQQFNQPPQFIPVPVGVGPDGQMITQPFQHQQQGATYTSPQSPLQTTGFELPAFGGAQQVSKAKPVDDDIIKELKSLKKAINKLTRIVESAILGPQPKPDDSKDTQENITD